MKKKLVSLLLISAMVLAVGCGSKEKEEDKAPADDNTVQEDTNTGDDTVTDEGTVDEGTVDEGTTDEGTTDEGTTDEGTDDGAIDDTTPAIPEMDDTLSSILTDVQTTYGDNYLASMTADNEYIEGMYGITSDMYEYAFVNFPMMIVHVDSFWGFKAAEGKFEDLKAAVIGYQDMLKNDFTQYPSNVPKIQASQVVTYGDYIFFVMIGVIENMEQDEAGLFADYTAALQPALDIIAGYFE